MALSQVEITGYPAAAFRNLIICGTAGMVVKVIDLVIKRVLFIIMSSVSRCIIYCQILSYEYFDTPLQRGARIIINHLSQFSFTAYLFTNFVDAFLDGRLLPTPLFMLSEETQRPDPPWCCLKLEPW